MGDEVKERECLILLHEVQGVNTEHYTIYKQIRTLQCAQFFRQAHFCKQMGKTQVFGILSGGLDTLYPPPFTDGFRKKGF